jgi:hypothetical protein
MVRGGTELKECRSDRSIAHCGGRGAGAGGEIRLGGVAHALTLSRPSLLTRHITFFNSRTQARERVCKSTVKCNTAKSHLVRIGNGQLRGVTRPHCFSRLPQGNLTRDWRNGGIKRCRHCHAAFHPKPRTKAEMFENIVASPTTPLTSINIRRHVKRYYYGWLLGCLIYRLIDYFVPSAILQVPRRQISPRSEPQSHLRPEAAIGNYKNASAPCEHGNGYRCNLKSLTLNAVLSYARYLTPKQSKCYLPLSCMVPLSHCNPLPVLAMVHESICLSICQEVAVVNWHVFGG